MTNEVLKTIANRMSIRKFKNKPVSDDLMEQVMTAATSGPNVQNFQPYTFIEANQVTKDKLAEIANMPYVASAPRFFILAIDYNKLFIGSTEEEISKIKENLSWIHNQNNALISAGIAADNFVLAANSLGLGVVTMSYPVISTDIIQSEMDLPDFVAPVLGLSIGYADQNPGIKPKLPINGGFWMKEKYDQTALENAVEQYNQTMKEYYSNRGIEDTWTSRNKKLLLSGNDDFSDNSKYFKEKGFSTK